MNQVDKLDMNLLQQVKQAFMAMPGGEPVAGSGMMTEAQAAPMGGTPQMDLATAGAMPPMDPAAMGGDPAAMGGDPAAAGAMPPADPAAAGAMPPMDPAAMGGAPVTGQITMSVQELIQLLQAMQGMGGKAPKAPKAGGEGGGQGQGQGGGQGGDMASVNQKLDQIVSILAGAMPQQ